MSEMSVWGRARELVSYLGVQLFQYRIARQFHSVPDATAIF